MRRAVILPSAVFDALQKAGIAERLSVEEVATKLLCAALQIPEPAKPKPAIWPPMNIERRNR
jgi:hypothetical protein